MRFPAAFGGAGIFCALVFFVSVTVCAEIETPLGDPRFPIGIEAQQANRWRQGEYEVWVLHGGCRISQHNTTAQAEDAVLWVRRTEGLPTEPEKVILYLENNVRVDFERAGDPHSVTGRPAQSLVDKQWFGRMISTAGIEINVPTIGNRPPQPPEIYLRGMEARAPQPPVQNASTNNQSQTAYPVQAAQLNIDAVPAPSAATPSGQRRIRVFPRSGARVQAKWFPVPGTNERVGVIDSGVNILIEGLGGMLPENVQQQVGPIGIIDIAADRIVVWTRDSGGDMFSGDSSGNMPIEFYMEGNIVFRQGDRIIYADRMYYDVDNRSGVILSAELLTPAPDIDGLVRLKADAIQQLNEQNFVAYGAAVTSSRMGVPRYWLQSEKLTIRDSQRPLADPFTGGPVIDAASGEQKYEHDILATSRNNFLYLGGVPVLYWPRFATDLRKPSYYIDGLSIRNDNVFGTQILLDLDVYQLLGWKNPPEGTDWTTSIDYLSDRGLGLGTNFRYNTDSFFGSPATNWGYFDAWGISDHGTDNLGFDRRSVPLEADPRGRILWRHRNEFDSGWQLTAEFGLISDRNFLEEYFEQEWDNHKDQTTGLELKRYDDNISYGVLASVRLNDFFTQTEWLPRLDHFFIGQSIGDRLTWYGHSSLGYGRLEAATAPTNAVDLAKFDPLAWEADREGVRASTRQEIDLPLEAGPVKIVPYLLGEAAYWGEDLTGAEITRLFGQAGVRASLPMVSVNPAVQSELLNLNGLAHKVTFETELFYADADQDLSRFPLYDQLDDDSTEHFRRRMLFDTFGLTAGADVPGKFDERFFALRSGLQSNVTGPVEIADDLSIFRAGVRQRWQTKRGLPGQERIIDWVVLDVQGSFFPNPNRDNFGVGAGLVDYDFQWNIGDRLALLSDGYVDFFGDGLRMFTVGSLISRPGVGDLYFGFRTIEGPFTSNIFNTAVNYRMSEKWIFTAGTSLDLGPTGNIGQRLAVTRIGESFLVQLGFNVDQSRGNFGVQLAIEPRFLPGSRLGRLGSEQIPAVGTMGLE